MSWVNAVATELFPPSGPTVNPAHQQGTALRDAGVNQVLDNTGAWLGTVTRAFHWWLETQAPEVFALEDFRTCVEGHGIEQPHHVNAWGGLAKRFAHMIEPVGYTQSQRPSAHARLTRTYKRKN